MEPIKCLQCGAETVNPIQHRIPVQAKVRVLDWRRDEMITKRLRATIIRPFCSRECIDKFREGLTHNPIKE